jgi:D-cysteine desulfhydrase
MTTTFFFSVSPLLASKPRLFFVYSLFFDLPVLQHQQFTQQLPQFHSLVTASGSGGTHAGLLAGLTALRCPTTVVGISTRHDAATQKRHILDLSRRVYKHVVGDSSSTSDEKQQLPSEDAVLVQDAYVGAGYSLPTVGMTEAVSLFARTEGILLDPVYSGKAAAGLMDLVRQGYFPRGSHVLFLHTGGAPSLYHYQPLYQKEEPEK